MKCEQFHELMVTVLYEEASTEEQARFDDHLAGCAGCQREIEALRRVRGGLRAAAPSVAPAPAPTVLVLGSPPAPRWWRWAGLAAAAAVAALGLVAVLSLNRPAGLSPRDREALREDFLASVQDYRETDRAERDALFAALQDEIREQEVRRAADSDALAKLLLASWSRTREDDLRFVLDRLGTLEQRTDRNQEWLQYAVFTGSPDEH
ncbi:MAG: zf-HC2 domain-containing protein [Acidobacteriota bacterium]|jgi:hypothetical protein